MKKNPVLVLTGLAVAAVAGIAGLTRDQWMTKAPETIAVSEQAKSPEPVAPAIEPPVAAAETAPPAAVEEAAPRAEASAPTDNPPAAAVAETPVLEVPAAEVMVPVFEAPAPVAEAPKVEAPAPVAVAPEVEAPAPVAVAPEVEAPAPVAVAPEVEAPAPVAVAPEVEAPAPVAEAPKVDAPAPVAVAPEVEAPAPVAVAPEVEAPAPVAVAPEVEAPAPVAVAPEVEAPAPVAEALKVDAPAPAVETPAETVVVKTPPAKTDAPPPESPPAAKPATVPTFDTVRVEKTGEAVIAGTAEAGAEVVVMLDGAAIGKTVANADGAFVVVPDQPLPVGSGALTIEAKAEGAANATTSDQTVAVIVPNEPRKQALVAIVSPNEPTKVLQKPEPEPQPEQQATAQPAENATETPPPATGAPKLVSLDAVDYDTSGNIVFTGRGQPGHSARIYVDNSHSGDATVGVDGRWAFAGSTGIKAGVHALRVDGIDGKGKVLNRVEVPFFREETNKVAAAAPIETEGKTDQEQPQIKPKGPKDGSLVIQPGNNLWRISKVLYGSGTKYTLLWEANKDQIRDPHWIYPGQVFMTPDAKAPLGTVDPDLREPMAPEEGAASAQ